MDWVSITSGCYAASDAIARTSASIYSLIREVREARSELDVVSGELHSLNGVFDLLKDDAGAFPNELAGFTPGVLERCATILNELEGCVRVINGAGISRMDKKFRWIACRTQISRLRFTLEAYKSTLGLALDLIAITSPHSASSSDTDLPGQLNHREPDRDREIARVLLEMGYLKARLEEDFQDNGMALDLQSYVDALQIHAEDAGLQPVGDSFMSHRRSGSVDTGNNSAPDSAIEMGDESFSFQGVKRSGSNGAGEHDLRADELDEFLDELKEMPSRPPTPPPKAARRLSMISRSSSRAGYTPSVALSVAPSTDPGPSDATSPSIVETAISQTSSIPATPTTASPPASPAAPPNPMSLPASPTRSIPPPVPRRRSSTSAFAPSFTTGQSLYTVVTKITAGSDTDSVSGAPSRSTSTSSRMGRFLGHMRNISSEKEKLYSPPIPEERPERPSSALSLHAPVDLVRRSSKCLQAHVRSHTQWLPNLPLSVKEVPDPDPVPAEPDAIFGVSLKKSMAVAKASATTHHAGSTGSSRREFPLCILKCASFLRQEDGLTAPHIFGEGGDPDKTRALQRAFSTGPGYGRDIDMSAFGAYAAADVIVLFLKQLPKPLVSESVASRWISLSRQATLPGSHAVRLEQCIDFWEEAMQGIRGPARSVFKLLLNLWGDVADRCGENKMTAERLAGRLVRPLMQLERGKGETDFLLGLAFLIRRRSEYGMMLRGEGRRSNAAF